jgi:hypothetical protein
MEYIKHPIKRFPLMSRQLVGMMPEIAYHFAKEELGIADHYRKLHEHMYGTIERHHMHTIAGLAVIAELTRDQHHPECN